MKNKKRKFSIISNTVFAFSIYWKYQKSLVFLCLVGILARVATPIAAIYLPKMVVDALALQVSEFAFVQNVGGLALALVLLNFAKSYTDNILNSSFGVYGSYYLAKDMFLKKVDIDYEMMEDPDIKKIEDKAGSAVQNNHTAATNLPRNLSSLVVNIFGLILYGGVIAYVNPWIVLLLGASALLNWFVLSAVRKYEEKTRESRSKINRKIGYVIRNLKIPQFAKDIRLYTMTGFLHDVLTNCYTINEKEQNKLEQRNLFAKLTDALLILIRDGASYAFLIYLLLQDRLTLGEFVLIFAAIGTLASWISGILSSTGEFLRSCSEIGDLRSYLEVADRSNTGKGHSLPTATELPVSFSLSGVSYTYPNSDKPAIRDINLEIKPGERIAIVGTNGAGKTTLIKLLCGLYYAKQGEIRVNNVDIREYNRDEYFSMFSAVFQDIHLTTTGIIGNVSSTTIEMADVERISECLRLAGLYGKVQSLPKREHTGVVRQTDENAIELSGGEKQKLALARALYKNAPVMILDEPTAALDPIAESEIYQKYAELTKGKTSVYISHRLASTRFCDRILMLDEQTIAEQGTHDELMKLNGKYAYMFNIQSSYYSANKECECNK